MLICCCTPLFIHIDALPRNVCGTGGLLDGEALLLTAHTHALGAGLTLSCSLALHFKHIKTGFIRDRVTNGLADVCTDLFLTCRTTHAIQLYPSNTLTNPTSPNWPESKPLLAISGLVLAKKLGIVESFVKKQQEDENLRNSYEKHAVQMVVPTFILLSYLSAV